MTPGDELINTLDDLRLSLNNLKDRLNSSGVERTKGLRDAMGEDCSFYRRSLDIFLQKDYLEIRNLIAKVNTLYEQIEVKNK